jgi:hypothetical protein
VSDTNPTLQGHPDDAELEALRTGEAPADVAAHASRCEACAGRLTWLEGVERSLRAADAVELVPFEREAAMRTLLAHEAARLRRQSLARRLRRFALPAAAVLLVAALLAVTVLIPAGGDARDLNADGRVDILDAFAMARRLETGGEIPGDLDLTRDGVVDRRDVDELAREAVSLRGTTS